MNRFRRTSAFNPPTDLRGEFSGEIAVDDPVYDEFVAVALKHQRRGLAVLPPLHTETRFETDGDNVWVEGSSVGDHQTMLGKNDRSIGAAEPTPDRTLHDLTFVEAHGDNGDSRRRSGASLGRHSLDGNAKRMWIGDPRTGSCGRHGRRRCVRRTLGSR